MDDIKREDQIGGTAPIPTLQDIDAVREEYPASRWSLENSTIVETTMTGLDDLKDPALRSRYVKNRYEVFKKSYGLTPSSGSLNVLMVAADIQGCGYARIARPAKYLNRNPQVVAFPTIKVTQELIRWAHVIVWQRQHKDELLQPFELARRLHKVQIFDIDDNMHALPKDNPCYPVYHEGTRPYQNMLRWMRGCDMVTVSKRELGEFYRGFAGVQYMVLPNCIDFEEFPTIDLSRKKGTVVRIGWAGSHTHYEDLRLVSGVLSELKKIHGERIEIVLMGSDGVRRLYEKIDPNGPDDDKKNFRVKGILEDVLNGVKREFHEFVETKDYCKALCSLNLDIAIIPLTQSKFNISGKSNIKYLEMSAAKVPCVLSKNTVYNEVTHGENGFLAGNGKDWLTYLERLIRDREMRHRMAENGYHYVRDNYDFSRKALLWRNAYLKTLQAKCGKFAHGAEGAGKRGPGA